MADYIYMYNDDGEKIECDNCGYPAKLCLHQRLHCESSLRTNDFLFCEVCSKTLLSQATLWPSQCRDRSLFRSIAVVANMILDKINESKIPHNPE